MKNNSTIAVDFLCIIKIEIYPSYILKINSDCVKQKILIMIPNEVKESYDYLVITNYQHY